MFLFPPLPPPPILVDEEYDDVEGPSKPMPVNPYAIIIISYFKFPYYQAWISTIVERNLDFLVQTLVITT